MQGCGPHLHVAVVHDQAVAGGCDADDADFVARVEVDELLQPVQRQQVAGQDLVKEGGGEGRGMRQARFHEQPPTNLAARQRLLELSVGLRNLCVGDLHRAARHRNHGVLRGRG